MLPDLDDALLHYLLVFGSIFGAAFAHQLAAFLGLDVVKFGRLLAKRMAKKKRKVRRHRARVVIRKSSY